MTATTETDERAARRRQIRPLLQSTAASVFGQGAAITAVPLLIAATTRSPLLVSLATACAYVPSVLIGLPAGALADRLPRRTLMVTAILDL